MVRLAITLLLGSALSLAGQEALRLDRLTEAGQDDGMPAGWEVRAVRGEAEPEVRLEVLDGEPTLVVLADSAAGQAWLELDEPLGPDGGTLSWEWALADGLTGADLRDPDTDDAAGRFFVVFGGGGLFGRPRLLFYTWGGGEDVEEAFISHTDDRVGVVVVRNASDGIGVWRTERRDPGADYRRVFGRDPDEIRAVGLMVDTDQLGGRAEVRLRAVRWTHTRP